LVESDKANTILDPEDFAINKIFYGVEVFLMGFSCKEYVKMQSAIVNNGGKI
jgi:hypothetical protein